MEKVTQILDNVRGYLKTNPGAVSEEVLSTLLLKITRTKEILDLEQEQARDSLYVWWTILSFPLLMFLLVGTGMVEIGAVRMKNLRNILIKLIFWAVGYGLAFGRRGGGNPVVGNDLFFLHSTQGDVQQSVMLAHASYISLCGCLVAALVSGACAERDSPGAYWGLVALLSALVVPVAMHWVWSQDGFLSPHLKDPLFGVGMVDHAGAGVLLIVAGVASLVMAYSLGPRLDDKGEPRFSSEARKEDFEGHNSIFPSLGMLVVIFGWYGFCMGGSTIPGHLPPISTISLVAVNFTLAGCGSFYTVWMIVLRRDITSFVLNLFRKKKQEPVALATRFPYDRVMHGYAPGLLSATGCAAVVEPEIMLIISMVAGALYYVSSAMTIRVKLDDPVDSAAMCISCGLWGLVAVALFAKEDNMRSLYNSGKYGLFEGGGAELLGAQVIGAFCLFLWTLATCTFYVNALRLGQHLRGGQFLLLRLTKENELKGSDVSFYSGDILPPYLAPLLDQLEALNSWKDNTFPVDSIILTSRNPKRHKVVGNTNSLKTSVQSMSAASTNKTTRRKNRMSSLKLQSVSGESVLISSSMIFSMLGATHELKKRLKVSDDNSRSSSHSHSSEGKSVEAQAVGSLTSSINAAAGSSVIRQFSAFTSESKLFDSIERPLVNFAVESQILKGEDFYSVTPSAHVPINSNAQPHAQEVQIGFFAVLDGHNGKMCAQRTEEELLERILKAMPRELESEAAWVAALPQAIVDGFLSMDAAITETRRLSGCTATVAFLHGWTLVCGNVGDSLIYIDTGKQVDVVSADHRLDNNPGEIQRLVSRGQLVHAMLHRRTHRPVGPLRAWPGGLCMSRSIGDLDVGPHILALPEVMNIQLPSHSGSRVIIASDGLWDGVKDPIAAVEAVRSLNTEEAAAELGKLAVADRGLRDDLTIIVVDVLPQKLSNHYPNTYYNRMKKYISKADPNIFGFPMGAISTKGQPIQNFVAETCRVNVPEHMM